MKQKEPSPVFYQLCEDCREKRKGFIKKVLIGIGAVGVFGAAVAAVLASPTSSNNDDYYFDNDYTGGDDGLIEDTGTAK